ncbi:unnamed protein product [Heligmosomoides polygyrus]|uniref:Structural protein n=1 Tax=Heligmosomoides polygyrus TaxID=6339 RepID=A0A183F7T4_HELPZ|nr:unnamed protein product [Heligmosomoides polygyrus]
MSNVLREEYRKSEETIMNYTSAQSPRLSDEPTRIQQKTPTKNHYNTTTESYYTDYYMATTGDTRTPMRVTQGATRGVGLLRERSVAGTYLLDRARRAAAITNHRIILLVAAQPDQIDHLIAIAVGYNQRITCVQEGESWKHLLA